MKIQVEFIDSWRHFDVQYRKEYSGFVLTRYNHDTNQRDSALLSGACFWDINHLQRVINTYQKEWA